MYVRLVGYSRIRILISQIKWHAHMTFTLSFEKGKKIDKNGTFIHQHRPMNHIVTKNQQQLF